MDLLPALLPCIADLLDLTGRHAATAGRMAHLAQWRDDPACVKAMEKTSTWLKIASSHLGLLARLEDAWVSAADVVARSRLPEPDAATTADAAGEARTLSLLFRALQPGLDELIRAAGGGAAQRNLENLEKPVKLLSLAPAKLDLVASKLAGVPAWEPTTPLPREIASVIGGMLERAFASAVDLRWRLNATAWLLSALPEPISDKLYPLADMLERHAQLLAMRAQGLHTTVRASAREVADLSCLSAPGERPRTLGQALTELLECVDHYKEPLARAMVGAKASGELETLSDIDRCGQELVDAVLPMRVAVFEKVQKDLLAEIDDDLERLKRR